MERIKEKYPDRVPIFVNKKEGSTVNDIERHKYLVPKDMTMGNFIYILKKNIKLESNQALFVFINNRMVCNTEIVGNIYEQYKSEDHFMYIIYSGESTFG